MDVGAIKRTSHDEMKQSKDIYYIYIFDPTVHVGFIHPAGGIDTILVESYFIGIIEFAEP